MTLRYGRQLLVLRIVGLVDGRPSPVDGSYLKACDVNARGGRGTVLATKDPSEALWFQTTTAAWAYWMRQSSVQPLRPDGKPNRPLTAYTVSIDVLRMPGRDRDDS